MLLLLCTPLPFPLTPQQSCSAPTVGRSCLHGWESLSNHPLQLQTSQPFTLLRSPPPLPPALPPAETPRYDSHFVQGLRAHSNRKIGNLAAELLLSAAPDEKMEVTGERLDGVMLMVGD